MELQIQDLVSSIKKEGIEAAQQESERLLAEARKQAEAIVAEAKAQAAAQKENAEKEIDILKSSAKISAEQAKRDAMLSFKTEVQGAFEKILADDVKKTMSDETLGKLIIAALNGEDVGAYAAEVAEVTDALKAQLADQIRGGLEIRPSRNVHAGFRLAAKDGTGYFDCTDEEVMKMLMPYFRELNFGGGSNWQPTTI